MTDIEQKALALVNTVNAERSRPEWRYLERPKDTAAEALCRALEAHEAFRQEVSDALSKYDEMPPEFHRFIIAKPDPLVEALLETFPRANGAEVMASDLRAALAARGLKIVEVGHD